MLNALSGGELLMVRWGLSRKTAPASILSAPAPGYSRSFVGAPTSTTCKPRFSDRWALSRS